MESQRVPQIADEASQVNQQQHERERVGHPGKQAKDRGKHQLAGRGGQKEPGCQSVKEHVPCDETVPRRGFGDGLVGIPVRVWALFRVLAASQFPEKSSETAKTMRAARPAAIARM